MVQPSDVDLEQMIIRGEYRLSGEVNIQGSKAAAQRILPATAALPGEYKIRNLPRILDSFYLLNILEYLGAKIGHVDKNTVMIDTRPVTSCTIPLELTEKSNGSFLFAGALLSRFGEVKIGQPSGDQLGKRPIDWHLDAFQKLGATIIEATPYYHIVLPSSKGSFVWLRKPSFNGTANAILASLHASGTTMIHNAAAEPEIDDLIQFLNLAGARIKRHNTKQITIQGTSWASGYAEIDLAPDHVDAATFAIAGVLCKGPVRLKNIRSVHLRPLIEILTRTGAMIETTLTDGQECLTVECPQLLPTELFIRSGRFPNPSTDWGPMLQVLMTQLPGVSVFCETIFEQRFFHVSELIKMGAAISPIKVEQGDTMYFFEPIDVPGLFHAVQVMGPQHLHGASVRAHDIRAGAALTLAALVAEGQTELKNSGELRRGYEDFDERLRQLGANVSFHPTSDFH